MNQWALPTIAVLLIGYGAVSGRLQSTVVTQAMVFVALGLLVGNRVLDLVDVDAANQFVRLWPRPPLLWCCSPTPSGSSWARCAASRRCRPGCSASACR